jgi:multidrug resistance efflux pump
MTWKRILILALVLVAAGTAIGFFWPRREAQTLVLPGLVEIQEVRLGSKIGGRVKTIETREGYIASPNQTLVTLDVPELEAQRRQAEARLQQAQFDLEKARNGPRAEEKEAARMAMEAARQRYLRVKNGPRPEEIVQARNDLKSAEADLQLALDRFDRAEQLLKRKAISTEEYEAARSNRDRLRAVVGKMRAYLDQLLRGSRQEDIDEAKAQFDQAQANYNLLLAGTAEALGKLQEIEASLREAVVQAPERVVVEVLSVRPGDLVAPNQPMIRVLRADDLWVKAYVPETQLGKVRLNQEVQVTIDSYPDRRFTGTIIQVASEAEFTPRNVQSPDERRYQVFGIKVRVPDPQGIFKSGMAAEVTVPLQE